MTPNAACFIELHDAEIGVASFRDGVLRLAFTYLFVSSSADSLDGTGHTATLSLEGCRPTGIAEPDVITRLTGAELADGWWRIDGGAENRDLSDMSEGETPCSDGPVELSLSLAADGSWIRFECETARLVVNDLEAGAS